MYFYYFVLFADYLFLNINVYIITNNVYFTSSSLILISHLISWSVPLNSGDNWHHYLISDLKMNVFKFIHLLKCIIDFFK